MVRGPHQLTLGHKQKAGAGVDFRGPPSIPLPLQVEPLVGFQLLVSRQGGRFRDGGGSTAFRVSG